MFLTVPSSLLFSDSEICSFVLYSLTNFVLTSACVQDNTVREEFNYRGYDRGRGVAWDREGCGIAGW